VFKSTREHTYDDIVYNINKFLFSFD